MEGFALQEGVKSGKHQDDDYCFTLITPWKRDFVLKANTENERRMWMDSLSKVIARPMTDEDKEGSEYCSPLFVLKRTCDGLMIRVLDSKLSSLGSRAGWGHCVVFLGKTLYSHSAPHHPGERHWGWAG